MSVVERPETEANPSPAVEIESESTPLTDEPGVFTVAFFGIPQEPHCTESKVRGEADALDAYYVMFTSGEHAIFLPGRRKADLQPFGSIFITEDNDLIRYEQCASAYRNQV